MKREINFNDHIGETIRQWIRGKGLKQQEVAGLLGIKPPSLSQMLSGRIPFPKDKLMKVIALLEPPAKEADRVKKMYMGDFSPTISGSAAAAPECELRPAATLGEVPVISFAQAAGYEPALEPVDDYAKGCSDETTLFSREIRPGYFALFVEGNSMSPDFPNGTVILVAGGEFPQRGDVVVAKLRDGQVVVKRYFRRNNLISLESINPTGKNFEWHCKDDPGFIQWMYPVLEATIDLRRRRWEQHRNHCYDSEWNGEPQHFAVAEDEEGYRPGKKD